MMEKAKRTAILLPESFCCRELSAVLTVLYQGCKNYDIFASGETVASEEGLTVLRTKNPRSFNIANYDSLFVAGSMDIVSAAEDSALIAFLRCFDSGKHIIAGCSTAPLLLIKSGLLAGRSFTGDVTPSDAEECGIECEDSGLPYGFLEPDGVVFDDNMLTAAGAQAGELAAALGELLGLEPENNEE